MSEQNIFSFEITNAYFLKPLFVFEKSQTSNICLAINSRYVKFLQNSVTVIFPKVTIETNKLRNFEYYQGEKFTYYVISTEDFYKVISSLKKKEDLLIGSNSKDSIFVAIYGASSREDGHEGISILGATCQESFIEKSISFSEESMRRMITSVSPSDLGRLLTSFIKSKSDELILNKYPSAIKFLFSTPHGTKMIEVFGAMSDKKDLSQTSKDGGQASTSVEPNPQEPKLPERVTLEFKIPTDPKSKCKVFLINSENAASLLKACKISPSCNISFYHEVGKPLKILIPLSGYGDLEIFIFGSIKQ